MRAGSKWLILGTLLVALTSLIVTYLALHLGMTAYHEPFEPPPPDENGDGGGWQLEWPVPAPQAPAVLPDGRDGVGRPGWSGVPSPAQQPPARQFPYSQDAPTFRPGSVDDILRRLDLADVAYNSPETMLMGTAAEIELLLSLATPVEALTMMLDAVGKREGARIRASNRMEAHLSGPQFDITPVTPEVQAVSREEITKWEWNVMPKAGGRHSLHLVLNALLTVDGENTPRTVRTFQREIVVEVSWGQRAVAVLDKHGQWLWGAVLIPVLGWAWRLCRSRNKADSGQAR